MHAKTIATAAVAMLLAAGSAEADIMHYQAVLKGANEKPPTASHGRGELTGTLDTDRRVLDYTVTYSGLSGPVTVAGFHDRDGAAAQVAAASGPATGEGIHATLQLTGAQVEDLNAGRWSFNISTKANPDGEVSGDLQRSSGEY